MSEREFAESVLKEIYSSGSVKTTDVEQKCKSSGLKCVMVFSFLSEHTSIKKGGGNSDWLISKIGSANFVFKGCWSGEEEREKERIKNEKKENSKNRRNNLYSAIIGAVVGVVAVLLTNHLL